MLDNHGRLLLIKSIHTVIWVFFVTVIGYIVYAGVSDRIDALVWIAIALVVLEGAVLAVNNGSCPLTPMAAKFTRERSDNFDIFLPQWLARHNKAIFSTIYLLGVALVIYRIVT